MYSKILVAHEHLADASHDLDKAVAFAAAVQAQLFVLGILSPGPEPIIGYHASADELEHSPEFKRLHEQTETWSNQQKVRPQFVVRVGHAVRLIAQFAEEFGADLLVLGDIGHADGWGAMLEHGADGMSLRTRCDVLIVR